MSKGLPRLYALVSSTEPKVRHVLGLPQELNPTGAEPVQMPPARLLIIEEGPDGVLLLRYSAHGEFAGDTWHDDVADAKEQAAFEFDSAPDWVPVDAGPKTLDELVPLLLAADGGRPRN